MTESPLPASSCTSDDDDRWHRLALSPEQHRQWAAARRAQNDELGAVAHLLTAEALNGVASTGPHHAAATLCTIATGYLMKEDFALAARWYRLALQLDERMAEPYLNLAHIYSRLGRVADAASCREKAFAIQRVFVEPVPDASRNVLILCCGQGLGNIPVDTLLGASKRTRIKYMLDYAAAEEDAALPPYDLVFNAIGDADVAEPLQRRLAQFAAQCQRPLFNQPAAVAQTQRHLLPQHLGHLADVLIAPCLRYATRPDSINTLAADLTANGIHFPVLLRPCATHGGEGLQRCDDLTSLDAAVRAIEGAYYLTQYVDYRSADGLYRKYRAIFIDGKPLPYHLAISSHWMVHYFSADMLAAPWKIQEEMAFLSDPASVLGARAWAALTRIGETLTLAYAGSDFTLLPDGRILVFEANATMLVHRERLNGPLVHKNPFIDRILLAFEGMLAGC